MTTMTTQFDLDMLTKSVLSKVAKHLGEKADWARETKESIIALIDGYELSAVEDALRSVGASDEDIDNMRIEGGAAAVEASEAIEAMMDSQPPSAKAKPVAATAPDADQVSQIASLLASVLATNKGAIDEEKVASIAGAVAAEQIGAMKNSVLEKVAAAFSQVQEALDAKLANMPARKLDVTSKTGTVTIEGMQHKQFDMLLKVIGSSDPSGNSNLNVWLTGMPGTGKTRAASNAAEALGMKFFCNGSIANKYELIGFKDAHGNYQSTPFRDAWENGGIYLFDEVDGSVPSAVLAFNSALANGIMAFPDGMLKRHKDCIIIAAANTNGQGATAELVGRMKQDAAFLDRFVMINWLIDEALERHIAQNDKWTDYVQRVRRNVVAKGVKVMVTPRATFFGAQLLASGVETNDVKTMCLKKGMTDAQWEMVA
jgi:cobaltochelatase CobS